jgi:hypothetical protein
VPAAQNNQYTIAIQQNSLPNFLEAFPGGESFQKIGCAIIFAQALIAIAEIESMLGDRPYSSS